MCFYFYLRKSGLVANTVTFLLQRDQALEVRKKFVSSDGDHETLLNIYRGYKNAKGNKVKHPLKAV